MRCEEAQELITARVDNELSADERVVLEEHLSQCTGCTLTFAQESVLKRRLHLAAQQISAPAALRRLIEEQSAAEKPLERIWSRWRLRDRLARPGLGLFQQTAAALERIKKTCNAWSFANWFTVSGWRRKVRQSPPVASRKARDGWSLHTWLALPRWRRALILATVVAIVAVIAFNRGNDQKEVDLLNEALALHGSILNGKTTLLHAVNLAAMRQEMASAVGDRFRPVVLDFSKIKLYAVAGFIRNVAGRDMLVTVYEGDGPTITCFTFLGGEADAPRDAKRVYDAVRKISYYSFSHDGLSGVLHQEGDVMCLVVAKMAPADLLALMRGKSARG